MAFAKAVVTGTVFRAPEKRFTQNNVPVSSFVLNIGDREEMLIRVVVGRVALDEVVSGISKDDRVLVEGRLQITTVKNESGAERRIYESGRKSIRGKKRRLFRTVRKTRSSDEGLRRFRRVSR